MKKVYSLKEEFNKEEIITIVTLIDSGILTTEELFEDFEKFVGNEFDDYSMFEFKDYYCNLLTHKENLRVLRKFNF